MPERNHFPRQPIAYDGAVGTIQCRFGALPVRNLVVGDHRELCNSAAVDRRRYMSYYYVCSLGIGGRSHAVAHHKAPTLLDLQGLYI